MLRGVCLLEMMANHLPSNILTARAVETAGFISAAEGFVFLSGFVAGWTSAQALRVNKPRSTISKRFLKRALQLYVIYLALFTIILFTASTGGSRFSEWRLFCDLRGGSAEFRWLLGATFLHLPKYLDIFSMYCIFLLCVPMMLRALKADRQWLLLAISAGIWGASQVWRLPGIVTGGFGFFNVLSWQLMFTAGVVLGFRHDRQAQPQSRGLLFLSAITCLALLILRYPGLAQPYGIHLPYLDPYGFTTDLLAPSKLVEKSTLGPLRLINFAAMAYTLWSLVWWLGPAAEATWAFQKLAFLGRHSLQVFSWSIGVTFLVYLSGESWLGIPAGLQIGLFGALTAALWIPALLHRRWQEYRPGRGHAIQRRAPAIESV